jgi:serine phosphatase RsbU (regulator of sigma subunit)
VAEVIATGRTHINQAFQAEPAVTLAAAPSGREPSSSAAAATVMVLPILGATGPLGAVPVLSASQRGRSAQKDLALLERLARRIGTAVENARLYAERLEIGHTLQRALLPATLPAIDGLELQARFLPASGEVGGDFYDVIHRHPDRWILAIGDVCGKGARAAAVTALARHTLRAAAISGQPPTQMLETLHEALRCHSPVFELCTVCLVVVEPAGARAQLTIALAGHPRPLIISRAGYAQPQGVPGTLLGAPGPIRPGLATVSLEPGETLLLYTDGVLDAGRPDNRLDGHGLIEACRHPTPTLAELLQHIERIALDRAAGKPRDDLALLALRHTPSPTATPTRAPAA